MTQQIAKSEHVLDLPPRFGRGASAGHEHAKSGCNQFALLAVRGAHGQAGRPPENFHLQDCMACLWDWSLCFFSHVAHGAGLCFAAGQKICALRTWPRGTGITSGACLAHSKLIAHEVRRHVKGARLLCALQARTHNTARGALSKACRPKMRKHRGAGWHHAHCKSPLRTWLR